MTGTNFWKECLKKNSACHYFILIVGVLLLVVMNVAWFRSKDKRPRVCFNHSCVNVDKAITPEEKAHGLSGREGLKSNEGMLFVFEDEGIHSFWMKDMLFNLDMIWLNKKGEVVHTATHLKPCTPQACPKYFAGIPASYVLEVNEGFVDNRQVKIGSKFQL